MRRTVVLLATSLVIMAVAPPGHASPAAGSPDASVLADFDGDGFADNFGKPLAAKR